MNLRKIAGGTAAALLGILLAGVYQQASAYTPGACRQDAAKLCPGAAEKEVIPCLNTHAAELSMDCQVNLAEARQVVRDLKDVCKPDLEKFCKDVQQGQGRIRRCLKAHETELTPACQSEIAGARKKYGIHSSTGTGKPAAPENKTDVQ